GEEAGQDEPHFHVHLIPRRTGDGFDIPLPFDGSSMPDRTVLDAYAARIIAALRDPVRPSHDADDHENRHARNGKAHELELEEGAEGELLRKGTTTRGPGIG